MTYEGSGAATFPNRWRHMATAIACTVILTSLGTLVASAALRPQTTTSGSATKSLGTSVKDSSKFLSTKSQTFTTLTTRTFTVPATVSRALIVANFTGSSECTDSTGASGQWCLVRLSIDGGEMDPQTGAGSVFDSSSADAVPGVRQSHDIARSMRGVGPGTHTLTVEWEASGPNLTFVIDDYQLQIEMYR